MSVVDEGFSGKRAAEIVGITYRQLDYWARTDLIRPSLADAAGSGSRRRYSYRNLLELKLIKTLLDAGIRLESVRSAFSYLRENLGEDIASARLVISGTSAVLVRDDSELIDVVSRTKGQGVLNLNILELDNVRADLDNAIELHPATAGVEPRPAGRRLGADGLAPCLGPWPRSVDRPTSRSPSPTTPSASWPACSTSTGWPGSTSPTPSCWPPARTAAPRWRSPPTSTCRRSTGTWR